MEYRAVFYPNVKIVDYLRNLVSPAYEETGDCYVQFVLSPEPVPPWADMLEEAIAGSPVSGRASLDGELLMLKTRPDVAEQEYLVLKTVVKDVNSRFRAKYEGDLRAAESISESLEAYFEKPD